MPSILSHDNINIHYVFRKGSKETLIFLHGWCHNKTVWKKEIDYFSKKGYSIIALDLRGHGKSGKPSSQESYSIDKFARDLKTLIDFKKIHRPILIGHSFGGMVVLTFEHLFPNIAKKLVLIDTTYENPLKNVPLIENFKITPFAKNVAEFILEHNHLQKKHFIDVDFSSMKTHSDFIYWLKGTQSVSLDSLLAVFLTMTRYNEHKTLPKIKVPTLIIEGEKDHTTPKKIAHRMHNAIKHSSLCIISNDTHDTNIRNPDKINACIENFLRK